MLPGVGSAFTVVGGTSLRARLWFRRLCLKYPTPPCAFPALIADARKTPSGTAVDFMPLAERDYCVPSLDYTVLYNYCRIIPVISPLLCKSLTSRL